MPDHDDVQHRHHYDPAPDDVIVRDADEDDMFEVRMPIASTGEVRNQGDDPLSRDELAGMARQLEDRQIGVFPEHGADPSVSGGFYSQLEKMGYWADPDVESGASDDGEDVLMASARMPDPNSLPEETGEYRRALAVYKAQAERGIALSSSIGWRQDDDAPGGNDLMEASIVGIPADPRTDSAQSTGGDVGLVARAAVDAGADPDQLVDTVQAAAMGPENERYLSDQQRDLAQDVLDDYRDAQGDGSVENFESWFRSQWELDDEKRHATRTALRDFYRAMTPRDDPVSADFEPFLDANADAESETEGREARDSVTDNDDTDSAGDEPADDRDDEPELARVLEDVRETQREQAEALDRLSDTVDTLREDDDEEDDDEDDADADGDGDSEEDGEGDDEDDDDDRTVVIDGEERAVDDVIDDHRDALEALREGGVSLDDVDVDHAATDDGDDGADEDESDDGGEERSADDPTPHDLLH